MKIIFLCIIFLVAGLVAVAQQNRCTVKLNGKVVLVTEKEDTLKNQKKISSAEWKKSGKLEILFKEPTSPGWNRDIYFADAERNEIWRKDSISSVSISLPTLRKLMGQKKVLKIHTVVSPANPMLGVRIRLVHLCTLKLP